MPKVYATLPVRAQIGIPMQQALYFITFISLLLTASLVPV